MQSLPQISVLDGLDRIGSPCDIPGLEDYVDLLLSSDTSHNEAVIFDAMLPLVALYLYYYDDHIAVNYFLNSTFI